MSDPLVRSLPSVISYIVREKRGIAYAVEAVGADWPHCFEAPMSRPHRRTSPNALTDCHDRLRAVGGILAAVSDDAILARAARDQALADLAEMKTLNAEMVNLLSD